MDGLNEAAPARLGTALALAAGLVGGCADDADRPRTLAGADPDRGLEHVRRAGCAACHQVPGVAWPQGRVGGSLASFGARPLIAGRLPNQPDVLAAFIRDAPALAPEIAMPAIDLTEAEARDVAAFLYTLDDR